MQSVQLLLVQVKDKDVEQASALISEVVEEITMAEGTIFHIVSAIIIATFDFGSRADANPEVQCEAVVSSLRKRLGNDISALYGMCIAVYGNFGSPNLMHYGPFIHNMSDLLAQLRNLELGSFQKIEQC